MCGGKRVHGVQPIAALFALMAGLLLCTPQATSAAISCTPIDFGGPPADDSVGAAGDVRCFTFFADLGDVVRARLINTSGTLDPNASIVRPDGTTLCGPTRHDELTCRTDVAGVHAVFVRDFWRTRTGAFALSVQRLNDPVSCTPLSYGVQPILARIGAPGQASCFTLPPATVGDHIRVRLVRVSGDVDPNAELIRPDGTVLCGPTRNDEFTCQSDAAGAHVLYVRDFWGARTGESALVVGRLDDPVGCSPVPFGGPPAVGSIGDPGAVRCFVFPAVAGDVIRVRLVTTSGNVDPNAELVRPVGTTLCGPTRNDEFTCTADTAGVHAVFLRDFWGTRTGGFALSVQRLNGPVACTPLSYGVQPMLARLGAPGEASCFTLPPSVAGEHLRVRLITATGNIDPNAELLRPVGTVLCGPTRSDEFTCQTDRAGSHAVYVRDFWGSRTGDVAIVVGRLDDPVGCSPVLFGGPPAVGSIGQPGELRCFVFSASAGDVIRVRLIGTSGNIDPNAELVRPNGTTLCGPTRHDEFTCTVDTTGAHAVFLRDFWGTRTGGFALSLQRLNDPLHCTALSPGAPPLLVRVGVPGETSCFTFPPSAAGDSVDVRVSRVLGDIDPHAELVRPNGTTLCGPTRSDEFTCQTNVAGHHALYVRDFWGGRTGEFSLAFAIAGSNPPPPPSPVDGPGDPIIELTFVPPYGSSLDLKGKVSHVVPAAYHVAVYIRVGAGWWTKPYWSRPATPISADGTWSCDITTGGLDQRATEIVAFLIPATYSPPLASGQATLPAGIEAAAVARIAVTRTP